MEEQVMESWSHGAWKKTSEPRTMMSMVAQPWPRSSIFISQSWPCGCPKLWLRVTRETDSCHCGQPPFWQLSAMRMRSRPLFGLLTGFFRLGSALRPESMERPSLELLAYPLLGNLEDGAEFCESELMPIELWHRLPEDILERILLFMPARSICRLRVVCKRWRRLLSSSKFFRCKEVVAPLPPLVCSIELARVNERKGPPRHCIPITPPKPYRWDLSFIPKVVLDSLLPEDATVDEAPFWSVDEKVDSLDSLLCITGGGRRGGLRNMIVVNPATRTYRPLPPVPSKYFGQQLRSARVALDEPFGTTFTLTWHMQSQSLGNWVVGVYSSTSNSWSICEGQLEMTSVVDSEVCGNMLYRLVRSGHNSYRCILYSFDTGRFVRKGEAPTPQVVVPSAPHGDYFETEWNLLEHCGSMYLIAQILLSPGLRMHGFEIWKLDVGDVGKANVTPSRQLKFQKVGDNPAQLIQQLFPASGPYFLPLRAMSSVGDNICLVVSPDSLGRGGLGYEAELRHVVAFDVPRRAWQLLYEESDNNDRLVPLGEGQGDRDRTSLPSYPFMVPNFHVFL